VFQAAAPPSMYAELNDDNGSTNLPKEPNDESK
jgi:hypothetical protein